MHTFTQQEVLMEKGRWNLKWSQKVQKLVDSAGLLIEKNKIGIDYQLRWREDKDYNSSGICGIAISTLSDDLKVNPKRISKEDWNRYVLTYKGYLPLDSNAGVSIRDEVKELLDKLAPIIKKNVNPELLRQVRFESTGRFKGRPNMLVIIVVSLLYFNEKYTSDPAAQ